MNLLRHLFSRVLEQANADGAASGAGAGGGDTDNGDAGTGGGRAAAPNPEVEARARNMGWSPRDQWRGNPDHWIDAQTFVQRGEQVLPVLQANLRQRDAQLATVQRTVQQQAEQIRVANEQLQVLTNISTAQGLQAAKDKRRQLLREQAEARSAGNTELEIDLGEQIADVTAEINAPPAAKTKQATENGQQQQQERHQQNNQNDPTADPAYQAFLQQNSWFGVDRRRTALATAIGEELRADPSNNGLVGKAFFDRVAFEVNRVLAPQRQTTSKVEGANGNGDAGGGGGGGDATDPASGKSYADLPDDAKQACDRQGKSLIGEGRAFKDAAAWRKYYVTMYFNS